MNSRHDVVSVGRCYSKRMPWLGGTVTYYAGKDVEPPSSGRRPSIGDIPPSPVDEIPSLEETIDVLEHRHPGLKQEILDSQRYWSSAKSYEVDNYLQGKGLC